MIDKQHDATLYVGYLTAIDSRTNQNPTHNPGAPDNGTDFEALASAAGRALAALRIVRTKRCACCAREFHGIGQARYCSDACRVKAWRKATKDRKENEQAEKQA